MTIITYTQDLHSGTDQFFTVPYGVTLLKVTAAGGAGRGKLGSVGGSGDVMYGEIAVVANQIFKIKVGQTAIYYGETTQLWPYGRTPSTPGNGEWSAQGGTPSLVLATPYDDTSVSTHNILILAGGGGGAGFNSGDGGNAGYPNGLPSPYTVTGGGGDQTHGGFGDPVFHTDGAFLSGGDTLTGGGLNDPSGMGGVGFYGGGGGERPLSIGDSGGPGGGGSSYVNTSVVTNYSSLGPNTVKCYVQIEYTPAGGWTVQRIGIA